MWDTIEHIAALIGVISTIGGIVWAFRYRRKLSAKATFCEYILMPSERDQIKEVQFGRRYIGMVTITNRGRKEIKDLSLHLPCTGYYKIGASGDASEFDYKFSLGDLRAGDKKLAIVWTDTAIYLTEEDEARVTYADDFVRVKIARHVYGRLGRLAAFLEADGWWFAVLFLLIGMMIILLITVEIKAHVAFVVAHPPTSGP